MLAQADCHNNSTGKVVAISVKKLSSYPNSMQEESFSNHPDYQLLLAIRHNDQQAIAILYSDNYKKVEYFVLANNGSADDAKDIYQEAFLAMWRNVQLDRFRLVPGASLEAYLARLAKNKWIDHLRSAGYKKTISLENEGTHEWAVDQLSADENDFVQSVKINFQQLGEKCRDILTRFYYLKQSMREIAAILALTEATARNSKYRCLEQLRGLVKRK